MNTKYCIPFVLISSLAAMAGCSSASTTEGETTTATHDALRLGARGPEVRDVYQRLAQYGYFPNAALSEAFPHWHPVVPVAPEEQDVFDANIELAVKKFQINYGMPSTGIVDQETRSALNRSRCAHPDSDPTLDTSDKFDAVDGPVFSKQNITYSFVAPPTAAQEQAIQSAANGWTKFAKLSFSKTNGTGDIKFHFCASGSKGCPMSGNVIGWTSGTDIWIENNNVQFGTIAHEIGHAIGLSHSGLAGALMYPEGGPAITRDDEIAVRALYGEWIGYPGVVTDIASGGAALPGNVTSDPAAAPPVVWAIGGRGADGNGNVYSLDVSQKKWTQASGAGQHIAVDALGNPWIVNANHEIWRSSTQPGRSGLTWTQIPGAASDIAIGANEVWVLGSENIPGGHHLYRMVNGNWTDVYGAAAHIAIGQDGRVWAINDTNNIYRQNAARSDWEQLPGAGIDIGANGNAVWVVGTDNVAYVWDEQAAANLGYPSARPLATWTNHVWGSAAQLTVDIYGRPWAVNGDGGVYMFGP